MKADSRCLRFLYLELRDGCVMSKRSGWWPIAQMTRRLFNTHLSWHVFSVHWAYISAAGSLLAKKPTRWGGFSRVLTPSWTSESKPLTIFLDSTTLQVAGVESAAADMCVTATDWPRMMGNSISQGGQYCMTLIYRRGYKI